MLVILPFNLKFISSFFLSAFVPKEEMLSPALPTMDISSEIDVKNTNLRPEAREKPPAINDMDRLSFSEFKF